MTRNIGYEWSVIDEEHVDEKNEYLEQNNVIDDARQTEPAAPKRRRPQAQPETASATAKTAPWHAGLLLVTCGFILGLCVLARDRITEAWTLTPTTVSREIGEQLRTDETQRLAPLHQTVRTRSGDLPPEVELFQTVAKVDYDGDVARVDVIVSQADAPGEGYQEMRFLRKEGDRWIDTEPQPDYWGDWREKESAHLYFIYREWDAAAVEAAVPQIDAAYTALRTAYGITVSPGSKVTVTVQQRPVYTGSSLRPMAAVHISSPKLRQIPVTQSQTDVVAQQAITALAKRTMAEVTTHVGLDRRWRWLEEGLVTAAGETVFSDPATEVLEHKAETVAVESLLLSSVEWFWLYGTDDTARKETAAAFGCFLLTRFGHDRIGEFLLALEGAQSWDDVNLEGFDTSVDELDAAWQRWIKTPQRRAW